MATIGSVASALANVTGRRKTLILFSEGIDYDITGMRSTSIGGGGGALAMADTGATPNLGEHRSSVLQGVRQAMAAATQANVTIYTIDPRSGNVADDAGELSAPPYSPFLRLDERALRQEMRDAQENLWALAEETGGFASLNPISYDTIFNRIVHESSEYYLLAFYPTAPPGDGGFRRVEVKVKRPGLQVSARKGYIAGGRDGRALAAGVPSGASPEVAALLMTPVPVGGLTLEAQAAAVKGEKGRAHVIVSIQADGQQLARAAGGNLDGVLEVALMALDTRGRIQATSSAALPVRVAEGSLDRLRLTGYRVITRLDLPSGRHQIRVAGRERQGGIRGSVFVDVEVPDFSKDRLTVSDLLITSVGAELVPTSLDEPAGHVLPFLPTASRTFTANDELTAMLELYDRSRNPRDVAVTMTMVDERGRETFRSAVRITGEAMREASGRYRYFEPIGLQEMPPGVHALRLEVRPARGEPVVRTSTVTVTTSAPPQDAGSAGAVPPAGSVDAREEAALLAGLVPIATGLDSRETEPREVVIRDEPSWRALWGRLPTRQPPPAVDFERFMVVGVFLGRRAAGGPAVDLLGARTEGATLVIEYAERPGTARRGSAPGSASPFALGGVEVHGGPVRFEARR